MRRFLSFFFALALTVAAAASAFGGSMTLLGVGKPAAGGGVTAQSIVTASGAQQYLTTTWSHDPTNALKATISYWQKFTNLGGLTLDNFAFTTAYNGSVLFDHKWNNSSQHYFVADDIGPVYNVSGGSGVAADTNWHHICIQIDTTAGTPRLSFGLTALIPVLPERNRQQRHGRLPTPSRRTSARRATISPTSLMPSSLTSI
jgi:hypothetical protein